MAEDIDERYDRQVRLAEIGRQGQARIAAHDAQLARGPGAGVALAYLVRAGVGSVTVSRPHAAAAFPHESAFQFSGPRAVAAGAHAALGEIRKAVLP